jgi:hypothetical protein
VSPPLRDEDRRDPVPGLLDLPAHLWRQLGPRGRKVAGAVGLLVVAGVVAGLIVAAPNISESKRERAAAERAEQERVREERLARLRAEVKPRTGSAPELADGGVRERRALVRTLEQAVLRDARERHEAGEIRIPVRTAACEEFPRRADSPPPEDRPGERLGRYECLGITSRIPREDIDSDGLIGYPFRAKADFTSGDYAWCKISGRPGEGSLEGQPEITVPKLCGGG